MIESLGSTKLVQVADTYALYPSGGSSGPDLHFDGHTVTAGQFGAWTPIGAEATASGYQVAWKMGQRPVFGVGRGRQRQPAVDHWRRSTSSPVLQSLERATRISMATERPG